MGWRSLSLPLVWSCRLRGAKGGQRGRQSGFYPSHLDSTMEMLRAPAWAAAGSVHEHPWPARESQEAGASWDQRQDGDCGGSISLGGINSCSTRQNCRIKEGCAVSRMKGSGGAWRRGIKSLPQGRGEGVSCPAGKQTRLLGSRLPSAAATGCAKDTLPWHEMPLPCELLPQGPSGAAAPGPCSV